MSQPKVFIIGSGMSGLVAAHELEIAGVRPVIIEKNDFIGGRVETKIVDGYPLDTGFQVLLTAYPAARRYLNYDALDLQRFLPGATLVKNGKYSKFGDFMRAPELILDTITSGVGTLNDKLKIYTLSRRLKTKGIDAIFNAVSTSTQSYLNDSGFSNTVVQQFFKPFYGGIFLDSELVTSARMFEFTFKMFAEGYAAIPAKGMQAIPQFLADGLSNTEFKLNSGVKKIVGDQIHLKSSAVLQADVIIDTTGQFGQSDGNSHPREWFPCTTHYFYTKNNTINAPLIGLVTDPACGINSFHFISDLFGKTTEHHCLSTTSIGAATDLGADKIARQLKTYCGIDVLDHIKSDRIHRALPKIDEPVYAPAPSQLWTDGRIVRAGDSTANGSLNAAMESGSVAAHLAIALLQKN